MAFAFDRPEKDGEPVRVSNRGQQIPPLASLARRNDKELAVAFAFWSCFRSEDSRFLLSRFARASG